MEAQNGAVTFTVTDYGIGCFKNIRSTFKLSSLFDAVAHLTKGKQTTMPEKHSGQGIFFTSKAASVFKLRANGLELIVDNQINDVILNDISGNKGTQVAFSIVGNSKMKLKDVFDQYANDEFEFSKTNVYVKLSARENEHISRSQAKRLLFGLEGFSHIILDFKGVQGIGQGFADEVFRIYQNNHPEIRMEVVNANTAVEFMIEWAK